MNTDIRIIPDNAFVGGLKDGGKRDVYIGNRPDPQNIKLKPFVPMIFKLTQLFQITHNYEMLNISTQYLK